MVESNLRTKSTELASGEKWVPTNLKPLDDEPLLSGKRVGTVILKFFNVEAEVPVQGH